MKRAAIIDFDFSDAGSDSIVVVEYQEPDADAVKVPVTIKWFGRTCVADGDAPSEVLEAVENEAEERARHDRVRQISDLGTARDLA